MQRNKPFSLFNKESDSDDDIASTTTSSSHFSDDGYRVININEEPSNDARIDVYVDTSSSDAAEDIDNEDTDEVELQLVGKKFPDQSNTTDPSSSQSRLLFLKKPAKWLAAFLTPLPTAMFGLFAASGMTADKVAESWTAWWNSMTYFYRGLSTLNAFCCEYVNFNVNLDFFEQFYDKMKASFKTCFATPKDFIVSIASIIFGAAGGIAAGALAFEGMQFFLPVAIAFACFNFSVFFIGRYLGVNKTLNRLLNRDTINTQRAVIDKLNHLKIEYKQELETRLQDIVNKRLIEKERNDGDNPKLSPDDFEPIFEKLAEALAEFNPSKFDEKTYAECAAEIAGTVFDLLFSTYIATVALITFTRKKRAGIEALLRAVTGTNPLQNLSDPEKIPAGILGGIASAMLYGISAMDFRSLFTDACKYLYEHPREIPSFLFDTGTNFFGASGMFNVGSTIPGNNEFGIPLTPWTYWTFAIGAAAGAGCINIAPALKKRTEEPNLEAPTVDQFKKFYNNPSINCISRETADGLRAYSLYAQDKSRTCCPVSSEELEPGIAGVYHRNH